MQSYKIDLIPFVFELGSIDIFQEGSGYELLNWIPAILIRTFPRHKNRRSDSNDKLAITYFGGFNICVPLSLSPFQFFEKEKHMTFEPGGNSLPNNIQVTSEGNGNCHLIL